MQPGKAADANDRLTAATSGSAVAAFAQLAAIRREHRRASEFPVGNSACTLEDMLREALRPMLQGWLDEKLPEIVERLVRAEVSRAIGEI
jgi:cell pole-organizing protein PopZ